MGRVSGSVSQVVGNGWAVGQLVSLEHLAARLTSHVKFPAKLTLGVALGTILGELGPRDSVATAADGVLPREPRL